MDINANLVNELETKYITDVLVCGSGPAGIGAALCAAKQGVKTMVVEINTALGGMMTSGMMSHFAGRSSSKCLIDIFNECKKDQDLFGYEKTNDAVEYAINHEQMIIVLERMFKDANISILYQSIISDVVVVSNRLVAVVVVNKSGRFLIKAKAFIDATGDGDVAYKAKVPFFIGREKDQKMQPATLMFKVGGVDYSKAVFPPGFETLVHTNKGELQALAKENIPFPAGHILIYRNPQKDVACCNMTNAINIDGTDAQSITEGLLTCRSQLIPILKYLREYVPGYEHCHLISSATYLGIRETRHFEGLASLEAKDILEAKVFDDWVVRRAWFNFDVHNLTGASRDETAVQNNFTQWGDYSIPYGCLLPKNIEGLLLSGRNISGSHLAHSDFRVMPIAMALGEAAGAAASLFIKQNLSSLKDVNVSQIQHIVGE